MQAPNGGFSQWGNVNEYQYWLSAYVTNFLLDAREQGFTVPAEMEKKAVDFLLTGLQQGVAGLPRGPLSWQREQRLERLALRRLRPLRRAQLRCLRAGAAGNRRRWPRCARSRRPANRPSGLGLVHLGLALKLMGDEARSKVAIDAGLRSRASTTTGGATTAPTCATGRRWSLLQKHELTPEGRQLVDGLGKVAAEIELNCYISTQEKLSLFLLGRSFANQQTGIGRRR